ncbi:hypothetical protein FLK61_41040 [Paenalkalicoccus suaedae]|uniref:Family 2 glycosyl transferase n=2 Tax=Paenalkalicoccus suaedae TaxID=2592382 RepID=A0A859FKF2_9BACI|nr:hypothetical protein FLK61_41040 [Paenalkalicoccus suaedae]
MGLIGTIAAIIAAVVIGWFIEEEKTLDVAIIDKTVSDETYREHLGLTWVLNHYRYVQSDGEQYDASSDYYGFVVDEEAETHEVRPLPESYDGVELIYIADTYGVYEEDLPWINADAEREGSRSEQLYGGMEESEWSAIVDRLNQSEPSTLIVEFNSFASPTQQNVQDSMTQYLGVDWSGWVGRYFNELDYEINNEIPQWVVEEHGADWNYEGPGFLLVNDVTSDFVVLTRDHVTSDGIEVALTELGEEVLPDTRSSTYEYWFDIVVPEGNAQALATYSWELTEAGESLLEEQGIPTEFASIVQNTHGNSGSYYFAGDFNDVANVPSFERVRGLPTMYRLGSAFSDNAFYWNVYVPTMRSILAQQDQDMIASSDEQADENRFANAEGISHISRVNDQTFEVLKDDQWEEMTIKGVNIGKAKPGTFPGEAGISEEEYYQWFEMIGEMEANSIRVYTLHPPGFYRALKQYNDEHEDNIYVFHGIWVNEEILEEDLDAFHEENTEEFQQEMEDIVNVIHGNAIIPPRVGHASGTYQADISEYVAGWIIGIEWYPFMVDNTNQEHAGMGDYDGNFVYTENAEPFEYWLAEQMDFIASFEHDNYGWVRPLSFTNWVTTDILDHPSEPNEQEDMASVDPNVIHVKGDYELTNQFASYHVYPYYPDFFNFEEEYLEFIDHRGEPNSYAGYLRDLHEVHDMPVLVAEFGIPASRGRTHENPQGKHQGFISEEEQGELVANLYEDIIAEGMLGGMVFSWQDEWFKRTWNTMDYDNPDRRPFWSNTQTNEQRFGLLAFDRDKVIVNGEDEEWPEATQIATGDNTLNSLELDYDETFLYARINRDELADGDAYLLFDTVPDQGNTTSTDFPNLDFDRGVEFIAQISQDEQESRIWVDQYYDYLAFLYEDQLDLIEIYGETPDSNSGNFETIDYVLNRELLIPSTQELIPFDTYETGKLRRGNADPESEDYDSLADYQISEDNGIIEIRIPWLLLHFTDPSQREVLGDFFGEGEQVMRDVDEIHVAVMQADANGEIVDTLPQASGNTISFEPYTWETWDLPQYEPRLKKSYDIIREAFSQENDELIGN